MTLNLQLPVKLVLQKYFFARHLRGDQFCINFFEPYIKWKLANIKILQVDGLQGPVYAVESARVFDFGSVEFLRLFAFFE